MILTAPMPLPAAVRRLESRTPVASRLTSAQWEEIDIGLRDRSFFSARVEEIRTVVALQSRLDDAITLTRRDGGAFMDRSRFIADMRSLLGAGPGDSGDLQDITSSARLGLIYDFNTEDAMEYGRWLARQDPDILAAFPCNELVRVEHREVPRGYRRGPHGALVEVPEESWPAVWVAAGGKLYDGRMIALKGDPIWIAISRFGRPWPPFNFRSGMGLADVGVDEAEQLGVIEPGAPAPAPEHLDFNHNLQASVPEATPEILAKFKAMFGDQVMIGHDGKIAWQGQRIARLYDAALAGSEAKWSLDLGEATPQTVAAAAEAGVDLEGSKLNLTADDIRHIEKNHGVGREDDPAARPVTSLDVQLIPHVWRAPDLIERGLRAGSLVFSKDLDGRAVLVTYDRLGKQGKWGVKTFYVRQQKGTP